MKKLLLIDGNYWLFSSYYATAAMGNLMTNKDGIPTNAVFGFANRLEACLKQEPDAVLVAFDAKGKTFRSELLEEYKATRKETPEELICQFGMVREYLDAHHIPRFELEGYEGDDILGTYAAIGEQNGYKVSIMTGDKDMMQLVSDNISVFKRNVRTKTDDEINVETFYEKYQLKPDQMRDLLGLMGDTSDNIPGIKGVGEKTALKLLYEYGTIENMAEHVNEIKGKLGEKIRDGIQDGLKSKTIATILRDVPVTLTLEELSNWKMDDISKLVEFYKKYDMNSFLKKMDLSMLSNDESEEKKKNRK